MTDPLLAQVQETLSASRWLRPGERVVLGVSGGPDSVALFHLFVALHRRNPFGALRVVHVDHQLRPDAHDDAAFVESLGRRWNVPVTVISRNVRQEARAHGWSLEDAARRLRYAAFEEIAERYSAARIVLAHTADDQAETVMMRMVRGAGMTGLAAIPPARPLGASLVIRPLLQVWRREILSYLRRHRLAYREDATNTDHRFLRNRVRGHLLPLLERDYNPNIKQLLHQLAEQCRTDMAFLHGAARRHWKRLAKPRAEGGWRLQLAGLRRLPESVQWQLIRWALQDAPGAPVGFEFRHWVQVRRVVADRSSPARVDLPGGAWVERRAGDVVVHPIEPDFSLRPSTLSRYTVRLS
ncbi:MAG: tRNA lysidine(34) synthetase TilS [Candidatus Omnitrophica bacterium]|nr:tRNA lysidine(34) synthetase TilS [Candidatus Omnitrophota bacterium]